MHDYKKLKVWNKAMDLVVKVYELTEKFPQEEKHGLISQMRRCAVSVPSNIAEGAGRNNPGEFRHFVGIANASAYELETQIIISNRLQLIPDDTITPLLRDLDEIQKMSFGLLQTFPSTNKYKV